MAFQYWLIDICIVSVLVERNSELNYTLKDGDIIPKRYRSDERLGKTPCTWGSKPLGENQKTSARTCIEKRRKKVWLNKHTQSYLGMRELVYYFKDLEQSHTKTHLLHFYILNHTLSKWIIKDQTDSKGVRLAISRSTEKPPYKLKNTS